MKLPNKMIAVRENVFVRWSALSPVEVNAAMSLAKGASDKYGKAHFFAVVAPECALPDSESRKTMSDTMPNMTSYCSTMSVVIEGRGLKGATLRSVAASFLLFSDKNIHVWSSLTEAVTTLRVNDAEELLAAASSAGIA